MATPTPFVAGLAAAAASLVAHATAAGEPPRSTWYADGGRRVEVERLAPAEHRGRTLGQVALGFPGRPTRAEALVDETAIVRVDRGAAGAFAELGIEPIRPLMPSAGLWLVRDANGGDGLDVAARLRDEAARRAGIREATPNLYLRRKKLGEPWVPNDPRLGGQWYFENLAMTTAWGITRGDASTTIVVVDTGCDLGHLDLAGKMDPGLDVVDGDDDPSFDPASSGAAHGTACAGLVAAVTDNDEGIAGGCPECRLRCVRLLADAAVPLSADVDAMQFALDVDAAVVSNSWGFVDPMPVPSALAGAIAELFENGRKGRGALVLFAMGNDDREVGDGELQAAPGVLGIGAINNFDEQTPFTNSGASVDLVAPTGTLTTDISGLGGDDPGDYTSLFGGTSSACPVAAGIAGLLVSAAPDRTSAELYERMIATARPAPYAAPDANGHDVVFGYGIIDPVAALRDVLELAEDPDAGAGGSGPDAGAAPTGAGAESLGGEDEEAGCACEAGPQGGGRSALAPALGALALCAARRRRAQRRRR